MGVSLSRWPSLSHRNRESGWQAGGSQRDLYQEAAGAH